MTFLERIHEEYVVGRRARVLTDHLVELVPENARVLDVGCGDGRIASGLARRRPDVTVRGIDCLVRPNPRIPVDRFDGLRIPHADGAFDAVILVDVLHHADEPAALLAEAVRVARRAVILKDVALIGWMAGPTLRFMDRVGNARHRVNLPDAYWTREDWSKALRDLHLEVEVWRARLGLYRAPFSWLFERSFHFVARLVRAAGN
jgi:SAM-dependent methyltransferase